MTLIQSYGLGADCVSGGEIQAALNADLIRKLCLPVGKADWEIELALQHDIFCFNVESKPELSN